MKKTKNGEFADFVRHATMEHHRNNCYDNYLVGWWSGNLVAVRAHDLWDTPEGGELPEYELDAVFSKSQIAALRGELEG